MIIFLFVKFYAWGYGIDLSENARMVFMVFSLLESIVASTFSIVGYFVGQYESIRNGVQE